MFEKDRGRWDCNAVGGRGWRETEEARSERTSVGRALSPAGHLGGKTLEGSEYRRTSADLHSVWLRTS